MRPVNTGPNSFWDNLAGAVITFFFLGKSFLKYINIESDADAVFS